MKRKPPLTVEQVVALAKQWGFLEVNPLKYRKTRITEACFEAARRGLLRKERISCARFRFHFS